MGRLDGRTTIVTSSTGIAAASAELFAAEGGRVFVISRNEVHCRELVDRVTAAGGEAAWATADLTVVGPADDAVAASGTHPSIRSRLRAGSGRWPSTRAAMSSAAAPCCGG